MPKSALETDIEKATSEVNVSEDWQMYMDICDRIQTSSNGPKDGLKFIMKRVNHPIPHVGLQALTLLSACVTNCGKKFHLEICSREWTNGARNTITRSHEKISERLRELIKKWVEEDFKDNPQLALMEQFYKRLKQDGFSFDFFADGKPSPALASKLVSTPKSRNTEEDELNFKENLDLAIAMSLQEAESSHGQRSSGGNNAGSSSANNSSLYPAFSSSFPAYQEEKELFKVRALYDFEAAEDNEMTFHNGDIFSVLDNSDQNWWKGKNQLGVGLFPANFVTTELQAPVTEKSEKKVRFADTEQVEVVQQQQQHHQQSVDQQQKVVKKKTVISEDQMDLTLSMLKNASPHEIDNEEGAIVSMEDQCKEMGLLIEKKILEHDRKKDDLNDLNNKFLQALSMYQQLMKEPMNIQPPKQLLPQQQMYPNQPPQHNVQYQAQQQQYQYPPPYSVQQPNQQYPGAVPQYGHPDQYQQQQAQARPPQSMDASFYNQQGPTSNTQQGFQPPSSIYSHQIPIHSQQSPPQQPSLQQSYNQSPATSMQQIQGQQPQQSPELSYDAQQAGYQQQQHQQQQQQQQQQYSNEQFYQNPAEQYAQQTDFRNYDYNSMQNSQQGFQQQTPVYQ